MLLKHWTGTEADLMGILLFPGLIYIIGGSKRRAIWRPGLLQA